MVKLFKDVYVNVGFNVSLTRVVYHDSGVMTDNDCFRFLVTYPDIFTPDYSKIIIISYSDAQGESQVESYEMSYDDILFKYYFLVDRRFTYSKQIKVQFKARYLDGQEIVDDMITTFTFKNALQFWPLDTIDESPSLNQTVILEGFVTEHAVLLASSIEAGHVKIDNDTIKMNDENQIYANVGSAVDETINTIIGDSEGTLIWSMPMQYSTLKIVILTADDYFNNSTPVEIIFPTPFLHNFAPSSPDNEWTGGYPTATNTSLTIPANSNNKGILIFIGV